MRYNYVAICICTYVAAYSKAFIDLLSRHCGL